MAYQQGLCTEMENGKEGQCRAHTFTVANVRLFAYDLVYLHIREVPREHHDMSQPILLQVATHMTDKSVLKAHWQAKFIFASHCSPYSQPGCYICDSPCNLCTGIPWPPLIRNREIQRPDPSLCADERYDHVMITTVN
jgi:hypothetical protein